MNARRIEIAPLAVLAGSLLLFVSLFLDWYELRPDTGFTAFTVFEVLDLILSALALIGAAAALARLARGGEGPGTGGLDRAAPGVAAAALLLVLSQVVNHPPAAVGEDALSGQWLALGGAALMASGAVLDAARISFAMNVSARDRSARRERSSPAPAGAAAPPGATAGSDEPPPYEEARAAEPEVQEELYPDTHRDGPIGAWDPETGVGADPSGQETQAMPAPGSEDPSGQETQGMPAPGSEEEDEDSPPERSERGR